MIKTVAMAILVFAASFSGCGYTLSHGTGQQSKPTHTAYVKLFTNDTYEPLIEKDMTAAIQEEISMDGRWQLADREKAEMQVEGKVSGFELVPLSYDATERILEYRIKFRSDIVVKAVKTDGTLWKDSIESYADYRVTEDVTKTDIRRKEAVRMASKKTAAEFIIRVLDISEMQHEN